MKRPYKVKEQKSLLRLLIYALLIIVIILFLSAIIRIKDYSTGYHYNYKASDYVHDVENSRFGRVYSYAASDMVRGASYDNDTKEFRALGFYYEQAVLERAYRDAGMIEKADAFKAKKEEYKEALGSLSSKADVVEGSLNK